MAIKELEDACTKLNIKTTNKEKRQKPKLMQKLLAFARAHKKLLGNLWRSVSVSDKGRADRIHMLGKVAIRGLPCMS